jgi:hypothetical protein
MRVVLPVVGVLHYTTPEAYHAMLGLARYVLMLAGFLLMALVFSSEAQRLAKSGGG